jgi:hypothetical protein
MSFSILVLALSAVVLRRGTRCPLASYTVAVAAATLSSPVIWPHHFAALSIGFVVLARLLGTGNRPPNDPLRWTAFASFVLIGCYLDTSRIEGMPLGLLSAWGLIGSSMFLGVLLAACARPESRAG